jgi:hypothetical protein
MDHSLAGDAVMRALGLVTVFALAHGLMGCGNANQLSEGRAFRVRDTQDTDAQYIAEPLPGEPTPDGGAAALEDGGAEALPSITTISVGTLVVRQGHGDLKVSGNATANSFAVGLALDGSDDGHWVLPVGQPDPTTGELTWEAHCDFDDALEPGYHNLSVVAIDEDGNAGYQSVQRICIAGRVPDNLHACEESQLLPKVVISLSWDSNADLDLQLITPDGKTFDSKHRPPLTVEEGDRPVPTLDRDSNAACSIDGIRTENFVWNTDAPKGLYGIYVNMFDACKQPATRFRVEVYSAVPNDRHDADAGETQKLQWSVGGEMLDMGANAGTARGLFVTEFKF